MEQFGRTCTATRSKHLINLWSFNAIQWKLTNQSVGLLYQHGHFYDKPWASVCNLRGGQRLKASNGIISTGNILWPQATAHLVLLSMSHSNSSRIYQCPEASNWANRHLNLSNFSFVTIAIVATAFYWAPADPLIWAPLPFEGRLCPYHTSFYLSGVRS